MKNFFRYVEFKRPILLLGLLFCAASGSFAAEPALSRSDIEQWVQDISNWGRWGSGDQLGTLNLITPDKRRQGAALVKEGVSVSLALPVVKQADEYTPWPLMQGMLATQLGDELFVGDLYSIAYHGYSHSHLDALGHLFYQGQGYNGIPASVLSSSGLQKLDVENMHQGIVSRGVLMDIPALRGVPYLPLGEVITVADLEAWEKQAKINVGSGDVLLIRTGRWARRKEQGGWNAREKLAGLHPQVALWLKERDVAVMGSDGVSDKFPSPIDGIEDPVHLLALVALGMPLLDNLDLEALAEQAAKQNRWEFMFVAAPLRVRGGTGSPLNPIAVF